MSRSLRRNIYYRSMLRNKYRRGLVTWETYRRHRNRTTVMYTRSKLTYIRERCEGGPRNQSFWKTIRRFLTTKFGPNRNKIILNEDGIGFSDGLPASYYTNDGFQDILCTHESHSSILDINFNQSDVQKIMESLNTRKAHGVDGMPAILLKLSTPILADELSRLINDPIDTCSFPNMFK